MKPEPPKPGRNSVNPWRRGLVRAKVRERLADIPAGDQKRRRKESADQKNRCMRKQKENRPDVMISPKGLKAGCKKIA